MCKKCENGWDGRWIDFRAEVAMARRMLSGSPCRSGLFTILWSGSGRWNWPNVSTRSHAPSRLPNGIAMTLQLRRAAVSVAIQYCRRPCATDRCVHQSSAYCRLAPRRRCGRSWNSPTGSSSSPKIDVLTPMLDSAAESESYAARPHCLGRGISRGRCVAQWALPCALCPVPCMP